MKILWPLHGIYDARHALLWASAAIQRHQELCHLDRVRILLLFNERAVDKSMRAWAG
jgi:hypothetical protein